MNHAVRLLILCLAARTISATDTPAPSEQQLREAVTKSVRLLQQVQTQWKQDCFSCHHQVLPAITMQAARAAGIAVDDTIAAKVDGKTFAVTSEVDAAVQDTYLIDPAMSTGSLLIAAHAAGVARSLPLAIHAFRLGRHQRADGHWTTFDARPPSSYSLFTATSVAARAMSLYAHPSTAQEVRERLRKAQAWLEGHDPHSTEDSSYRLIGLVWTGAGEEGRRQAAMELIGRQNEDGGWGQLPGNASDAYATGLAIHALSMTPEVSNAKPARQSGVSYLYRTQKPDGTWHVATRIHTPAPISPTYFESGFPYAKDQYISCSATSLAAAALAEWLPRGGSRIVPAPVTAASPKGVSAWMETAFFGTRAELEKALDAGLDVNTASAEGTSLLMFSVHDPAKVKLLLERGANGKSRSKSGHDALLVATLYQGNRESVEALLNAGVSPNYSGVVRFRAKPLVHAAIAGDADMVDLLIKRGASPAGFMTLLGLARFRPLDAAAQFLHMDVLDVLLRNGIRVDQADDSKMTQLSWAALMHRPEMVRYLLSRGANPQHRDKFGLTPEKHVLGVHYAPEATMKALKERSVANARP